jgi:hypothetical protein
VDDAGAPSEKRFAQFDRVIYCGARGNARKKEI